MLYILEKVHVFGNEAQKKRRQFSRETRNNDQKSTVKMTSIQWRQIIYANTRNPSTSHIEHVYIWVHVFHIFILCECM